MELACRHGLEGVRVLPTTGSWRDHDALVRPAVRARGYLAKDVYRHNTLPLTVYRDLEKSGTIPFRREEVLLTTGKGNSWNQVPALLTIDEDFGRLIGYYLSEGCITQDQGLRIRLAFGGHEEELLQDAKDLLERFGFRYSVHWLKSCNTVQIKISSLLLGLLLRDELGCGVRSEDAQVPARLMTASAAVRRGGWRGCCAVTAMWTVPQGHAPIAKRIEVTATSSTRLRSGISPPAQCYSSKPFCCSRGRDWFPPSATTSRISACRGDRPKH